MRRTIWLALILSATLASLRLVALGVWLGAAPLPTPRYAHTSATVNGLIHVLGGHTDRFVCAPGFATVHYLYDPIANAWSTKASPLQPRTWAGAVELNGLLYLAGGEAGHDFNCAAGTTNSLEVYDPATDRWTAKAPMLRSRAKMGTAVLNGRIYMIGGDSTGTVEAYDPSSNTWTLVGTLQAQLTVMATGVMNGILYVAGGSTLQGPTAEVLAFDPNANTWTRRASMPTPQSFVTSAVLGGRLYVIGGNDFAGFVAKVQSYDPATNTWRQEAPLPTPRGGLSGAVANGRVYALGGFDGGGAFLARNDLLFPGADPVMALDAPNNESTSRTTQPILVAGWAADRAATNGVGVDAIHVWAFPRIGTNFGTGIFLGSATLGLARPDVGAVFGQQFEPSGFSMQASGLQAGSYRIGAYAHGIATGVFDQQAFGDITVRVPGLPNMAVDTPVANQSVADGFSVVGWAVDRDAASGAGVDAVHVWAFRTSDRQATFLGAATLGGTRSDVGAAFGSQFTNSGYSLVTHALGGGAYDIGVYAHSGVTGTFNQQRFIRVNMPAGADVTGSWNGDAPEGLTMTSNSVFCDGADDVLLQLTQAGTTFTGTAWFTARGVRSECTGGPILGGNSFPVFAGTVSGSTVTFAMGEQGTPQVLNFTGTLSNNNSKFSGTLTFNNGTVGAMVVSKVLTNNPCTSSPCALSVPATYTFNVPANVSSLSVQAWGAGGGAGGGCINTGGVASTGGAAGGGGGYSAGTLGVTPGQTITIVVGASGGGGSSPTNGGASSVESTITANGGGKGGGGFPDSSINCKNSAPGGAGGTASGGTANFTGGSGTAGTANGPGGTGGSAAGPGGGVGGAGGTAGTGNGGNGQAPGGGAGGDGGNGTQGAAAHGRVVIHWQ